MEDAVLVGPVEGLYVLPSHIDLVGAEIELLQANEREYVLKRCLSLLIDHALFHIRLTPFINDRTALSFVASDFSDYLCAMVFLRWRE